MTTLYKLTDKNNQTYYGSCQWGEGVEHIAPGGGRLCTSSWIHAYTDPLLAILLNSGHANISHRSCRLWLADGDIGITDHGLKVGCTRLRTIERIHKPVISDGQLMGIVELLGAGNRLVLGAGRYRSDKLRRRVAGIVLEVAVTRGIDVAAVVHRAMELSP